MVLVITEYPYPIPSFRVPVPAPDVEPTDAPLVSVCFNYEWLPYVLGALNQLTLQSTWAGFNDPPDVLAMRRGASLVQQFALAYDDLACPVGEAPTPYWDEATDLDDEETAEEQGWYGHMEGETFVERLEDFVIAGFIAYAGSIGGALFFLTIAPKFRLAWKTGNLGGIIRIFVDSADYGTVDTYSETEGVLEMDIVADPEVEEHTVRMVLEELPA